ncbi:hypothetical protein AHAS_Ahas16G0105600 [Arachis hypogaea]|uniref:GRF-type domain-containing protein n=1 Tax=Arachis hypogaea TaxID=3818 RepID=A0A444YKB9_ARAHY|nr:hypothetical protein Ahy_B06g081190 [Arachis hypogaea]
MASASRRSTNGSYSSGNIMGECFCECGLRASLQVSNSIANPGRKYYACPIGRCRWFRWASPSNQRPSIQHSEVADDRSCDFNSNLKLFERVKKLHNDVVFIKLLALFQLFIFGLTFGLKQAYDKLYKLVCFNEMLLYKLI